MRVLLTGATGFLGRVLARRLVEAGHAVAALVRERDVALAELGIEELRGDITQLDAATGAVAGREIVVHTAARVAPFGRVDDYYDANVRGTDNLLAACEIAGVRKFVFTSCAGVVLDHGDLNGVNESQRMPAEAPTPYLATKALAERHVLAANGPSLATVALRPHFLWGPGEPRWLPRIAALAKSGRLRLFGEPGKKIDSCYVDNAADAHVAAVERLAPASPIAGKAYFITQGEPASIDGFVNGLLRAAGYPATEIRRVSGTVARMLASTAPLRRAVTRSDPLLTTDALTLFGQSAWFNIAAARRDLGYAPRVGMSEGLSRVSAYLARERMRGR
ncbi:MAG TPA: NAD-dependent epimerase/dehydratase family protein [Rhodanobacteraceae bacterium]|nr:NAD-dependent epimerase/dehydratase family protein [Rhodanobacteraceae bacterium]